MNGLLFDLRQAVRSLWRSPSTVALTLLTFGLGIASTTVIFSAVEGVLINPIRLEEPDRYVTVYVTPKRQNGILTSPPHELVELWVEAQSFELLEATRWVQPTLTGLGPAETLAGMRISDRFHRLLRMAPILGRTFTREEMAEGGPDVVLLSHGFWRERFGGRQDALGQTITLDGRPHQIVGVLPAGFMVPASLITDIAVWLPYRGTQSQLHPTLTGKLEEGVTREGAEAELESLMAGHERADSWEPRVVGTEALIGKSTRSALELLMAAVAVLLMIAALNVANLLLGRAHRRMPEIAIRAALGAGRGRIARQLLVESVLLGVVAAAVGVLLANWGLAALQALRPGSLDALDRVTLNSTVLAFAGVTAVGTSLFFGLAPAVHAASVNALTSLRSGQRLAGYSSAARRFRLGVVVVEVALSAILLVGAGLLVRTMAGLYRVDPGFQAEGVIRADLQLPSWKYADPDARLALAAELEARLRAVPGATAVAASTGAPPRTGVYFGAIEIEGREVGSAESGILYGNPVGPGYFEVLRQPILEGRGFTAEEAQSGDGFVIGRSMARRYWGDGSPIGARIRLSESEHWSPVVGVVEDATINGLGTPPELQIYSPADRATSTTWLIRAERATEVVSAAVREAIHAVDLDLVADVIPVSDDLRASVGRERFIMVVLLAFGSVAVILAAVGCYGVLSHLVAQQRREIGIRMSLGADEKKILHMVVRQGGAACVAGLLLGLPAAFLGSSIVASQLYGVGRSDVLTYLAVAVLVAATSLLASWLPAKRAARVDPIEVIREEYPSTG